jgi:large subunit ribosomal protein L18
MNKLILKKLRNVRRRMRIKKKLKSNPERLRLCINKSNSNFYAQIIDDIKGHTVLGVSTLNEEFKDLKSKSNMEAAKKLGKVFAEKALQKNIKLVVFDRNGYLYHGKVKAFADAVREGGLQF